MNYVLCETFRVASGSSSRINMVNLAYPRKRLLLIVYFYQMYKYLSLFFICVLDLAGYSSMSDISFDSRVNQME